MLVDDSASALFWKDRWRDSLAILKIVFELILLGSQGAPGSGGPSGTPLQIADGFRTSRVPESPGITVVHPYLEMVQVSSCLPLYMSSCSVGLRMPNTHPRASTTPLSTERPVHTLGGLTGSSGLPPGSVSSCDLPIRTATGSLSTLRIASCNTCRVTCYVTNLRIL